MKPRLWSLGLAAVLVSGAARAQTPPVAEEAPPAATSASTSLDPSARIVAFMTVGLGVAGIGVGAVYGVAAISKKIQSDKDCNAQNLCTHQGVALQHTGQTEGDIATATLAGGAALFGTGLLLFLAPPRALPGPRATDGAADARARLATRRVRLELTPTSASLVGSF